MNKEKILDLLERKSDIAYTEFEQYCLKNGVDETTSKKASRLLYKWLAIDDLIDELEYELKD